MAWDHTAHILAMIHNTAVSEDHQREPAAFNPYHRLTSRPRPVTTTADLSFLKPLCR